MKLLKYRYPIVTGDEQISVLKEYLSKTSPQKGNNQNLCVNVSHDMLIVEQFLQVQGVNADLNKSLIESYVSEHSKSYPMRIGTEMTTEQKNQMVLFLVNVIFTCNIFSSVVTFLTKALFQSARS